MIQFFTLLLIVSPILAQAHNCSPINWVQTPKISAGVFSGKMEAVCQLQIPQADIPKLHRYFEAKALDDVIEVHSGPVRDQGLGLPGQRWDITARTREGEIRNILRMGGNGQEFAYSLHSKEIDFSGMGSYLQKLDIDYRVKKISHELLEVKLENRIEIQKPRIAPGNMFLRIGTRNSEVEFQKNLDNLLKEITQNI
jgi:hypothetical protein